jgi:NitT/TauT family transport system substrate-binding protein
MAKLMNDNKDNSKFAFSVKSDASDVTAAIIAGDADIAALPTNVAAKLYQESEGKLQLLALNTLGVLHLLQNGGTEINEIADLRGKTIYLPGAGSNPEYITAALLESAGLQVGVDVMLDTTSFNSPDALATAIESGAADLAVLPEPKVTVTMVKNPSIVKALDFSEEWEKISGENTLVQGCLVVNTAFAEAHPAEINQFLKDYKTSVDTAVSATDEAIEMIVSAGILPSAAIAKKALPKCNLCFIAGEDMKSPMKIFCEKIFAQAPASIGAVPDDNFYYVAK